VPSFKHPVLPALWLYLAAAVGVGGVWVALFARELASRPLIPLNEPELATVGGHA
jgi:hypothetical protein